MRGISQRTLQCNLFITVIHRYSYHEVDVKFLDKLSVQLTHTQVQIKTEVIVNYFKKSCTQLRNIIYIWLQVAASNSQSQQLLQLVHTLNDNCYTCQHPNPDKPVGDGNYKNHNMAHASFPQAVTPSELINSLATLFGVCSKRVEYLHCSVTTHKAPSKVGFLTESSASNATPAPISAVNVTKSILE